MTNIKFEGDIENFSEPQLKLITTIIEDRGFIDSNVTVEAFGKKGDNFSSFIKRITVKKNEESFSMIAKVAPTIEIFRKAMNIAMMFKNEIFLYSEVLKKYQELLESANVPLSHRIKTPICYGFISEPPNEIILLENLQESGYILVDKQIPLNGSTLKFSLKILAMFHALAYVLKYRDPNDFARMKSGVMHLKSELDMLNHSKIWMLKLEEDLFELMDDDKYKNVISGSFSQLREVADKVLSYDFDSKYSVIQQGGYYSNNILFKFHNESVIEAVMIDFQASRTASPASDLLYLFLSCTEYDARCRHFTEWINYYYLELGTSLEYFALNVAEVYPRHQLDADLKRHGKLALALSLMVVNAIIVKSGDEVSDFKDRNDLENVDTEHVAETGRVKHLSKKTREKFKTRVQECIDTLIEFEYL